MMKLNFLGKKALAVVVAGLAAIPAVSQAALINSLLISGVVNEIQDTDAERILAADGTTVVTSGNFAVGQIVQSILRFDTANSETIADTLPSPYKLTALSELKIAAIQGAANISGVDVPNGAACAVTDAKCTLIFSGANLNLGSNVLAALYEGPTFSQSAVPSTGISGVQSNTLITTVGLGKLTDFWFATITNSANQIGTIASATATAGQAGQFIFGLSVLSNPGGLYYQPEQMTGTFGFQHDVIGNGSAYARSPGVNTGWLLSSNTLIQFVVPEPGSLALVGALVVAAGVASTRRKQAKV